MILLCLLDILGILLLDVNLADLGLRPQDRHLFPLVNCLHGLYVALYELLLDLLELLNQGAQIGKHILVGLFCGRAEGLLFCFRGSLEGCASVEGQLVGVVRLRVVKAQLRGGNLVAVVRL
jgi:hypothetical protein